MSGGPRFLVFGASGHIGGPLAAALARVHGAASLRLASSSAAKRDALGERFPGAEAAVVDYLDQAATEAALAGVEAVFVVTPDFFPERRGAEVLLAAAEAAGVRPHVVRVQAEVPGMTADRLPPELSGPVGRRGHLEARALIERSGLPATFLNVFGYYMDDLLIHFAGPLRDERTLLVPYDRPMCWIDPRDLGEAAARVMAGPPPAAPRLLHLNSGEDGVSFSALAAMLSEELGTPIRHVDDPDAFGRAVGPMLTAMTGDPRAADYLLADWRMERDHAALYRGIGDLAALLGREPVALRPWIAEHRARLLG
ncbi:NAD(P)H-binding protein [Sphingomonas lenta]|uniref:NmrA family NAD(P)-binding protein n=1 Tax=Sphingomonas lenta TaxID=1141887 RepID=UPI0015959C7F|nr:NAD(P)H-binding protein [Sphingomonas lenta]